MRFRLLGSLALADGPDTVVLQPSKPANLLAALLLHANSPVSAEYLQRAVWGEEQPATARAALQTCVLRLRRLFSKHGVTTSIDAVPGGYRITAASSTLDLLGFRERVRRAAGLDRDPEAELCALRDALSLWQGSLLANVRSVVLHRDEVPRLAEERLRAVERVCDLLLGLGRCGEALVDLWTATRVHPGHERFHEQLIEALYRSGRQSQALAEYRRVKGFLLEELGVDPSPSLRRLELSILRGEDLGPAAPSAPRIVRGEAVALPPGRPGVAGGAVPAPAPDAVPAPGQGAASIPVPGAVPVPDPGAVPVPAEGAAYVPAEGAAYVAAQGAEPASAQGTEPISAQGASPAMAPNGTPVTAQGITTVPGQGGTPAPAPGTVSVPGQGDASAPGEGAAPAVVEGAASVPAAGTAPLPSPGTAPTTTPSGTPAPARGATPAPAPATVADSCIEPVPAVPHFTGRVAEAAALTARLTAAPPSGPEDHRPLAVLVSGAPGIGKSALAQHAARLVRDAFPGGQLLVRMTRADGEPRSADEVAAGVAVALGAAGEGRALLILDDVVDADQVRPLLSPGGEAGAGLAVVVTSRMGLGGLIATHGGWVQRLTTFTEAESYALLLTALGAERVEAEPRAAHRLAAVCGHFPAALRILTARLLTRPGLRLADAADWLGDDPLARLTLTDSPDHSVTGLFDRALGRLDPRLSEAFTRLAQGPPALLDDRGPEDEGPVPEAVREQLADAGLLEDGPPGPYRIHDLLRAHVRRTARIRDRRTEKV
ncbi:BTAD domain-containing putative transcriptional regulator [Streptomyces sp. SH5]|uniref:BTAD domain-containing putative transcriptional regulator n=1 Tax=Streptomyces sp. SH5 TaxID=3041765 RepID=UPI0024780804|nr:BTAD domain-containing putative transcriptional regulator [Streptomyces sp. SH5]WGP10604.1 BTAD domain-containing putative transcriptional regulator [Streptomyces sp. SH5]